MSKNKKTLVRIIISTILFIVLFSVDLAIDLKTVFGGPYGFLLPLFLYLAVYLLIGYDVLLKAFKNIVSLEFLDENFLMVIATIGAFAISEFEEGVAVLLLYQIGEFFQRYAVGKSRASIKELMNIRPDYANLLINGKETKVNPSEVEIDDRIIVKPGEKVPLDGIVVKGHASLDTKALTGESLPREVSEGEKIISGSINLVVTLITKVPSKFAESTVNKILDLITNASTKKSKAENFITKFSRYYTPSVVIGAILVAVIGGAVTFDWSTWVYRALNFLVISCPCALVISVPLTFFAGLGASSRKGILVKGGAYLDKYKHANIFVFDKTGTLTKGNFVVSEVYPNENKEEILYYASLAEKDSSHPIAQSIKKATTREINKDLNIKVELGKGIRAYNTEINLLVGNSKLLKENNIEFTPCTKLGTVVYVVKDNKYLGYILIKDEIKEEAKEVIAELNKIGKTIMLTGDNKDIANEVSKELGITECYSELLPAQKTEKLEEILENKNKKDVVCYIGDGINDAPSLIRSDIGISMGQLGEDAAIEASDIVLMKDNLKELLVTKKIARKVMSIVYENIVFAIAIKLLVLILSMTQYSNMWLAVFADVGVAVLAILNSLRANSKYIDKLSLKVDC